MAQRFCPQRFDDFPSWVRTAGAMKANGVVIKALCHDGCKRSRVVDLDRLIAAKGPDYSLIDRRCRCTFTPGCKGWIRFHYPQHSVYRGLVTEPMTLVWSKRDWEATKALAVAAGEAWAIQLLAEPVRVGKTGPRTDIRSAG